MKRSSLFIYVRLYKMPSKLCVQHMLEVGGEAKAFATDKKKSDQ